MLFLLACNLSTPGISGQFGEDDLYGLSFGARDADAAWGIAALSDGGAIVSTQQAAPESVTDAWFARLAADGTLEWSASWGGESGEQVRDVFVSSDRVYVAGATWSGLGDETADGFVVALELDSGQVVWEWTTALEGFERVEGVAEYEGVVYFSGWSTSNGNDAMVGALDLNGNLEWLSAYDSGAWDEANGSLVASADGLFVTGVRGGDGPRLGGDGMLASFALDGTLLWAEDLPECLSLCIGADLTSDGSQLYAIGTAHDGGSDEIDMHAFDFDGTPIWSARYGALGVARGTAIDARDGALVGAGSTEGNGTDVVVLEVDPDSGTVGNVVTWAGQSDDEANGVAIGVDAVWAVGHSESVGAGSTDGLLLHLPPDLGAAPPAE